MRTITAVWILPAMLAAAGCGGDKPGAPGPGEPASEASATVEATGAPGILRIDPGMLRDLRITTAVTETRQGGEGVTVLGEVGVDEEAYAEVGTSMEARVIRLLASPGDAVRKGQPLAELQSMELGRARAGYLTAKARAELASRALERKRDLAARRIAPVRELQEAEAEDASARADLQAAAAVLQAMGVDPGDGASGRKDVSTFVLTSPIAGTVIQRDIARGRIADPSRPLFRVADLSRLWLTVHAFERDAVRIAPGTDARIVFSALPGRQFTGTVTLIGRQVDVSSRTIPVRVEIANEEGLLRPGMSATAWIGVGDVGGTIVAVPSACLQRMQDGWFVFLPRETGVFEMREVGRGRDLGGEIEILSGLRPGETVVVEGAFLLKAEAEKSRGEGEHHEH